MTICTALIILGIAIGAALVMLEYKMPGFLMTAIKNAIANGRAYGKKRHEMMEKGEEYKETYYDFVKGLKRAATFKPPEIRPPEIKPVRPIRVELARPVRTKVGDAKRKIKPE
jgi:hypothetical protein